MELLLLVKGLIIGLLVSIPLGPIGVICVQRTINKGRSSGFISGLGAATADTIFACIAGFSLTFILAFIEQKQQLFQVLGGSVVALLGVKIFFTNPVKQLRRHKKKMNNRLEDFLSVLALTITNPLAVFLFLAVFAAMGVVTDQSSWNLSVFALAGVFIGASLWWYLLCFAVDYYRNHFRLRQLWWVNKVSGAIIGLGGGVSLVWKLFF